MAKSMGEQRLAAGPRHVEAPSLSPSVRRHLGRSLRGFYASSLGEPVSGPVSERLEALLAKLDKTPG